MKRVVSFVAGMRHLPAQRYQVARNHHVYGYGSKSRAGTEIAAILYTLVETAKLHDVDPSQHLHEADRGERLIPWQLEQRWLLTGRG